MSTHGEQSTSNQTNELQPPRQEYQLDLIELGNVVPGDRLRVETGSGSSYFFDLGEVVIDRWNREVPFVDATAIRVKDESWEWGEEIPEESKLGEVGLLGSSLVEIIDGQRVRGDTDFTLRVGAELIYATIDKITRTSTVKDMRFNPVEIVGQVKEELFGVELGVFNDRLGVWLETQIGKYALIKGGVALGPYDTQNDAITIGYERFGNVPFLTKKIEGSESILVSPLELPDNMGS